MADPWSEWQPCFDIGGGVAGCPCSLGWRATTTSRERWLCFPTHCACLLGLPLLADTGVCQEINITYLSVFGRWKLCIYGKLSPSMYVCIYLLRYYYWCGVPRFSALARAVASAMCTFQTCLCVPLQFRVWLLGTFDHNNEHNLDNLEKCQIVQENLNHSRGADWLHEQ